MQLERTLDEKGRYLSHFDKKEDAEEFIDSQVRRYLFTRFPEEMTIRRICREAQDEGINLYPNTFGNELKRRGIEIRQSRPKKSRKEQRTFTITDYVSEAIDEFPKGERSFIVELGARIATGTPCNHVIMFLPEEDGETTLIFKKKSEKRIQLYISGDIDRKFEQQLRKLLQRAEKQGTEAIVRYAEQNGYKYYGGTRI